MLIYLLSIYRSDILKMGQCCCLGKMYDTSYELVEVTLVGQGSNDQQYSMSPDGGNEEELSKHTREQMRINEQLEETAETALTVLTKTNRLAEEAVKEQDSKLNEMQARVKQINPKCGDIPLRLRSQPVKHEPKSGSTPLHQYKSTGSKSLDNKLDEISEQLDALKNNVLHMGDQLDDENELLTIRSEERRKMYSNK